MNTRAIGKQLKSCPLTATGFQSHRDQFAISIVRSTLRDRIEDLIDGSPSDNQLREDFDLGDWDIRKARVKLGSEDDWEESLVDCLYRPFDRRFCYLSEAVMDRPRRDVMQHVVVHENVCLNVVRQTKMESWQHAVVSNAPTPAVYVEVKDGSNLFPLYLYPDGGKMSLFDSSEPSDAPGGRRPNLAPEFIEDFAARLKMSFIPDGKGDLVNNFGPEDAFDYMYAVFHSPTYRSRYAEFLKIDFPRLPLTSKVELFRKLYALGSELVDLHLMEKHAPTITTYPVAGENKVDKVRYTAPGEAGSDQGRVWINREQYFEGVPPELWNFHVGGYQVLQKWLKDRKGRKLTYDNLTHYRHIVSALNETIRLMSEIDAAIEEHSGWPIQ